MWFMQREDLKERVRDLEAVHNILMNLTQISVIRRDKELRELIVNVKTKVLEQASKLRKDPYLSFIRKLW